LAIKESIKLGIPIIAILDTNSDPEGIDFPIPGNDDARRSIDLYCNLIKETIESAKKDLPKQLDESNNKIQKSEKKNKVSENIKIDPKKKKNPLN
jgi:small subunit ribosomal protein S2